MRTRRENEDREARRTRTRAALRTRLAGLSVQEQTAWVQYTEACAAAALGVGHEPAIEAAEEELATVDRALRRTRAALEWLA
jgi:hypothetical protein